MNILFLINEFDRGGAERVMSHLLNYLPKTMHGSKFYLYLLEKSEICYPIPTSIEIIIGSKFHSQGLYKFFKLVLLSFRIKKVIKKKNIDIVLSFLTRSNYVNMLSKMIGSRHRPIISERNTLSWIYNKKSPVDIINRFLIRLLYTKCREIITVSQGVKNDLITHFNVPDKYLSVIYNPYDIKKIKHDSLAQINHPWIGHKNYRVVVTIGRLEKQKNHKMLIQSFKKVSTRLPDARLIIIGEGKERPALIRLITQLALVNKIDLIGQKINPFAYLAKADLFVLSSFAEGFPNVLLESMICGCPVISTDCQSGPNEIIISGENGILVPVDDIEALSDAMITLLKDLKLRAVFSKNAHNRALDFNLENIGNNYAAFLNHYA